MTHANHRLGVWALVGASLVAAACGASEDAGLLNGDTATAADGGASGTGAGPSTPSAAGPSGSTASPGEPVATGVVLVHAAAFPAFRLCFESQPGLLPQPDSKVMPEANVVGVELGSVVRVDPIASLGTIYVINEADVRAAPDDPSPPTCGELLGIGQPLTKRSLTPDNQYHVVDKPIATGLGANHVQVLAITGCGSQAFLNQLDDIRSGPDAPSTNCGVDWSATHGNLKAQVVDLPTTPGGATATTLPVQLFHMSSAIEAFRGSGTLAITFGRLDGTGAAKPVPAGALYAGGPQTSLSVDQTSSEAVYGAEGFHLTITGGAAPFSVDQSLADIQQLSSPTDLPTTYYRVASNYALMLLGDPAHQPTFADGGANPIYNPRRAVHMLAVPVIDPATLDGGADSGTPAPSPVTADGGA